MISPPLSRLIRPIALTVIKMSLSLLFSIIFSGSSQNFHPQNSLLLDQFEAYSCMPSCPPPPFPGITGREFWLIRAAASYSRNQTDGVASISIHDHTMASPFCLISPIRYTWNQFYKPGKISGVLNNMTVSSFIFWNQILTAVLQWWTHEYWLSLDHQKSPRK